MAENSFNNDSSALESQNLNAVSLQDERQAIYAELQRRAKGQRLTPAQKRIAQCLIEKSEEIGFLSSLELARLANVSQPSVTRFSTSLGFKGYLEMRRYLRSGLLGMAESRIEQRPNRYQTAAHAEMQNIEDLGKLLADETLIDSFGAALATSRPLAVLGFRAATGMATQFAYLAAKLHPDIRLLTGGGSICEDQLEQVKAAGGRTLLAFMMPRYPRETVHMMELAREIGLSVALVTDVSLTDHLGYSDHLLQVPISSSLLFSSYSAPSLLVAVLLEAMSNHMKGEAQSRLDYFDRSLKKRRVFTR